MSIWDIMQYCRNASQIQNQCKAELKRQQHMFEKNTRHYSQNIYGEKYNIRGLTEVQYKACMELLASENEIWKQKMTREEAIKKIQEANKGSIHTFQRERGYAEAYVNGMAALGFLKFEEVDTRHSSEKGKYIFFPNPDKHKDNVSVLLNDAVITLQRYGYQVVKSEETIRKMCSFEYDEQNGRIEKWPEGYCLWFNGVLVWKSWK